MRLISILLGIAFCAFLIAADAVITQFIPLGFELGLFIGGAAFWLGVLLCTIAFIYSLVARRSLGSKRSRAIAVGGPLLLLAAFALLLVGM